MSHPREDELVAAARSAHGNAYAPYSQFHVGAAVLASSGVIYAGANVESASYPVGICAERSAIAAAASAGERRIEAVAIVTDTDDPVCPCGMCRQMIRATLELELVEESIEDFFAGLVEAVVYRLLFLPFPAGV